MFNTYSDIKAYWEQYEKDQHLMRMKTYSENAGMRSSGADHLGNHVVSNWDYGKMKAVFIQLENGEVTSTPNHAGIAMLKTDEGLKVYEGKLYMNRENQLAISSEKMSSYDNGGRLTFTFVRNKDGSYTDTEYNEDGSKDIIERDAQANEISRRHEDKQVSYELADKSANTTITISSMMDKTGR